MIILLMSCMCGVMQEPPVRRRVARLSWSYPKGPLIGRVETTSTIIDNS